MTDLKSLAEKERQKRLAWGRAKQGLQEFLYYGHGVGTDRQQREEASTVIAFIKRMQELIR